MLDIRRANRGVVVLIILSLALGFSFFCYHKFKDFKEVIKTSSRDGLDVPNIFVEFDEWKNKVDVFQINREGARSFFIPYPNFGELFMDVKDDPLNSVKIKDSDNVKVLNGNWKFSIAYKPKDRNQYFFRDDYNVSNWDDIKVPSNWQIEGYDYPIYVNFRYPWTGYENLELYKAPEIFNPVGSYKRMFNLNEDWIGDKIYISFQGVESCLYLWINGHFVGYSEDSFSPSEFDITDFVIPGENSISVQVFRWSDGSFVEDQDFIRMSGIFRDVFLYRTPKINIRDFEVMTDLDNNYLNSDLNINLNVLDHENTNKPFYIFSFLFDDKWNLVNTQSSQGDFDESYTYKDGIVQSNLNILINVDNPKKWSAEDPNLYNLILVLKDNSYREIQAVHTRVGFREFEIKGNQMCINGKAILFKGINRHEVHPLKGRAISNFDMEFDIKEIKRNNINAVRTSHYPNNPYFVSLCNEYGVYLIDEANLEAHGVEGEIPGNNEIWRAPCLDRVMSLVERDKNNPCVLIWSLGNESGGGEIFKYLYNYVKNRDKTRIVHYEGEHDEYYASDIVSKMYVKIDDIKPQSEYMKGKPYVLCEYAHSMGNSGGSLSKYIEKFENIENVQGGFIWDFIDQSIYKDTPKIGKLSSSSNFFEGRFEGYIKEGYRGNGYSGSIVYDEFKYVKLNEFTLSFKVKPSVYEGEGCIYFKKGNEFVVREITNYKNSNNRVLEFFIRDNSYDVASIVHIVPENWIDTWHEIVACYDGKLMKLFLDGSVVGEREFFGGVAYFGDILQVGGNSNENHFESMNAIIDEIRFFSKIVELEDISKYRGRNNLIWVDFDSESKFLELNKDKYKKYLAFGGDFNDAPNDSSFCANGVLLSSRKLKPQMNAIKYAYRSIEIYDKDILNGEILIKNKNLFLNLDKYTLKWDYLVDGKIVDGSSAIIDLSPMDSRVFKIDDMHKVIGLSGREFFINFKMILNEGNLWANKGFEVFCEQISIPIDTLTVEANLLSVNGQEFEVKVNEGKIVLTSDEFNIQFDIKKGSLFKYMYRDEELISNPVLVDFWNPLNDNERLSQIYDDVKFWKDISKGYDYSGYDIYVDGKNIVIEFQKTLYDLCNSELIVTYKVSEYGDINVTLFVDLMSYGIPHARSVGFKIFLPKEYNQIKFYGRGPFENYNDRKEGSSIGIYETNVDNQFTQYIRPQRTGNLTDVRWAYFHRCNDNKGILFTSTRHEFLQINASKYDDNEFEKNHEYQMEESPYTIVNLRSKDYGSTFETFNDRIIDYIGNGSEYRVSFTISVMNDSILPENIWNRIFLKGL